MKYIKTYGWPISGAPVCDFCNEILETFQYLSPRNKMYEKVEDEVCICFFFKNEEKNSIEDNSRAEQFEPVGKNY